MTTPNSGKNNIDVDKVKETVVSTLNTVKGKVDEFLHDETKTGPILDKVEKLATDKLGPEKADKVKQARNFIDSKLGNTSRDTVDGEVVAEENPAMNPDAPEIPTDVNPGQNPTPNL